MNHLISEARRLVKLGDQFFEKHTPEFFHEEAALLLEASSIAATFNLQELISGTFNKGTLPDQNFSMTQFSDLPITLARGKYCFMDIYFWRRRPTVIHNHHFTGAFQCLEGFNVDLEFEFKQKKKYGEFHALGDLTLKKTRHLRKGDTKSIAFLDNFIHQNHHQSDLTVNLCFRTPEMGPENLSNFLYSGLRYEKNPQLLNRYDQLCGFTRIGAFNFKQLDLSIDDALFFIIQNFGSDSGNKQFLSLQDFLLKKIKTELDLDVVDLLQRHAQEMELIESGYD